MPSPSGEGGDVADAGDARLTEAVRTALDFAQLDDETVRHLVSASDLRRLPAGAVLFEKGSDPDGLYVVVSGTLRIVQVMHGEEHDLALIGPGDFTGEVSLALKTTRTRSAVAKDDAEVLVIPVEAFDELAAANPHLGAQLVGAFEERVAQREEAAAESD
jgi:CRP-like cAMP-binding protein